MAACSVSYCTFAKSSSSFSWRFIFFIL